MSFKSSQAKITQATKDLLACWGQTTEVWRDDKGRQFEEHYLLPLQSDIRTMVIAMERMDSLLETVRRDCQ